MQGIGASKIVGKDEVGKELFLKDHLGLLQQLIDHETLQLSLNKRTYYMT